jgi:hypothetical protein
MFLWWTPDDPRMNECKDTQLWSNFGPFVGASQCLYLEEQSQYNAKGMHAPKARRRRRRKSSSRSNNRRDLNPKPKLKKGVRFWETEERERERERESFKQEEIQRHQQKKSEAREITPKKKCSARKVSTFYSIKCP